MFKKEKRKKRAKKLRCLFKNKNNFRLVVHKTSRHIYAQILSKDSKYVLVSSSTLEKKVRCDLNYTGNKKAAYKVGLLIAKKAIKKGINKVVFDKSGFKYHGRIKVLADSSRKNGLLF